MNMHQLLLRTRCLYQRVVAGGHLTQTRADGNDQIAGLDAGSELRVQADTDIPGVQRVVVVKGVLKTESIADRQPPVLGKALQGLGRLRCPAATAGNHQRALGSQQHFAQRAQGTRVAPCLDGFNARQRLRGGHLGEHVFRQHQHHRAGPPVHGRGKGAGHVLRNSIGVIYTLHSLGKALGAGSEETGVIDFLKGLTVPAVTGDIAHQQDHGCGVLEGRVHADRGIGGPWAAGHHANARAPGQFAVGLGHEGSTTFLAAGHKFDLPAPGVHAVQHGQIALARHAKGMGHALGYQAVNKKMAGNLSFHGRYCAAVKGTWVQAPCKAGGSRRTR